MWIYSGWNASIDNGDEKMDFACGLSFEIY